MQEYKAPDVISAGYFSDISPDAIPDGGWITARNMHIFANKLAKTGGSSNIANTASFSIPGHIKFLPSPVGKIWVSCGGGQTPNQPPWNPTAILNWVAWTWDGTSNVDRTPVEIDRTTPLNDPWNFTTCIFSGMMIANHHQLFPMYLPDLSAPTKFLPLPWDATQSWVEKGNTCQSIGQFKNFLFAIGMVENGQELPYVVRWSDVADTGGLPDTWSEFDLSSAAGSVPLPSEGGRLLCGLPLRDSFIVYAENSIYAFDLVGGQFVFNVRVVSNTIGIISNNAVVNHEGYHYFVGQENIYRTDGNTVEPISKDKIRKELVQSLNPVAYDRAFAFTSDILDEIWFCVPTAGSLVPNYAFIFDAEHESFTAANIAETYSMNTGYPAVVSQPWSSQNISWQADSQIWSAAANTSGVEEVLFNYLQTTGNLPQLRRMTIYGGYANFPFDSLLVSKAILPAGNPDIICTCLELVFVVKTTDSIVISVTCSDVVYGPLTGTTGEIVIPIGSRRVQFRLTGRYFYVNMRSHLSNEMSLSSYTLRYVVDGQR